MQHLRHTIVIVATSLIAAAGCASTRSDQAPVSADQSSPSSGKPLTQGGPRAVGGPEVFESKDFIVAPARSGDTPETLRARVQAVEHRILPEVVRELTAA